MPSPVRASARSILSLAALGTVLAGGCSGGSTSGGGARPGSGQPAPPPASAPAAPSTSAPATSGAAPAGKTAGTPPPAHPVPPSFQIAAGAPSDAEVRRELAQMKRVQRAEGQKPSIAALFSPAAPDAASLLPWDLEPKRGVQVSVASVFRDYGLGIACGGVLGRNQLGVAHKTAPCGTLVTFRYAGQVIRVPVLDRGPYIAGREWDLTGAAADLLGFPGLGNIEWSLGNLRGRHLN